jgi:hypothetical protein
MSAPGSQFNIGSDSVLTVLVNGQPIGSQLLTSFEFRQMTTRLTSKPINSSPNYREVEEGWEGTLEYDRSNSVLDDFFAAKEAGRYAGQQPPQVTVTTKITNVDQSISRFRFDGMALKLDQGGKYAQDEKVTQQVGWVASRRTPA